MKFQIIDIEFDFTCEEEDNLPLGYQEDLICDTRTTIWDADDEDDLLEEITCATGWCIKSIDYCHVLV